MGMTQQQIELVRASYGAIRPNVHVAVDLCIDRLSVIDPALHARLRMTLRLLQFNSHAHLDRLINMMEHGVDPTLLLPLPPADVQHVLDAVAWTLARMTRGRVDDALRDAWLAAVSLVVVPS